MKDQSSPELKLDKVTFFVPLIILVAVPLLIILKPDQSLQAIKTAFAFVTGNFGIAYTWCGIFILVAVGCILFTDIGKIKMGAKDEKPEFRTITWGGMLFTAGIAAALMYSGAIEWTYYYSSPPLGVAPGSWQAGEMATMYSTFHWGIVAWSFYGMCALPIGYSYFVRKKTVLKISEVCRGVLGDRVDGVLGKVIDVLFIFSLVCGSSTSLAIAAPTVAAGYSNLFGIPMNVQFQLFVLLVTIIIFGLTGFMGLKKGIAKLSDINMAFAFFILAFVLLLGPTAFIINNTTTSIGLLASEFLRMLTWTDAVGKSGFPQNWTQFYWAWWMAYAPFMGLFIARISRGRTLRNMLLGSILFGSIGCSLFFWILGGFSFYTHISGTLNVLEALNTLGNYAAVMAIFETLPFSSVLIFIFATCAMIFTATTFNATSFTIAAVTTKEIKQDQEPNRFNILFWAFVIGMLPASLLYLESDLQTLQTATVVGSLPIMLVIGTMLVSFWKDVRSDMAKANDSQPVVQKELNITANAILGHKLSEEGGK